MHSPSMSSLLMAENVLSLPTEKRGRNNSGSTRKWCKRSSINEMQDWLSFIKLLMFVAEGAGRIKGANTVATLLNPMQFSALCLITLRRNENVAANNANASLWEDVRTELMYNRWRCASSNSFTWGFTILRWGNTDNSLNVRSSISGFPKKLIKAFSKSATSLWANCWYILKATVRNISNSGSQ